MEGKRISLKEDFNFVKPLSTLFDGSLNSRYLQKKIVKKCYFISS